MTRQRILGVVLAVVLGSILAPPAAGEVTEETVTKTIPMRWVWQESIQGTVVEDSHQTTVATAEGTHMTVVTQGLSAGHTFTLWFVYFNNPDLCIDPPFEDSDLRCGPLDLFNPLADVSLVFGDGLVATGVDDTFEAYQPARTIDEGLRHFPGRYRTEQIAWGTGILADPLRAEYQAVLRNHGPEDPHYPDQTTTHNGGCRPLEDYHCTDDQASGFRASGLFQNFE